MTEVICIVAALTFAGALLAVSAANAHRADYQKLGKAIVNNERRNGRWN